jgi:hypothetical protein
VAATVAPLRAAQRAWSAHWTASALSGAEDGDDVIVTEGRWGFAPSVTRFAGADAAILRLCWQAVPWHALVRATEGRFAAAELRAALARLAAAGLLVGEGDEYLSLVLRQPGPRRAPTWREIRAEGGVSITLS